MLEAGGGIPCRPNPAATLLVSTIVEPPLQSGEQYEVGSLAVDGWAVTFGTVMRGLC